MTEEKKFQRRYDGGAIEHHESFAEACNLTYDKISFDLSGGRLILRSDGTWEYWDEKFFSDRGTTP